MIANTIELEVACRNMKAMEQALDILRSEMETTNPALFAATSKAYILKAQQLRCDIAEYLSTHPDDISLLLRPGFAQVPLAATKEMEQQYLTHYDIEHAVEQDREDRMNYLSQDLIR
ncbi:MAG TPA: hypothetical protein VKU00_31845 [Chthonomonadaceae bacterium]|nr:hypothetical protein [Chthonomonadaceae bacterium]